METKKKFEKNIFTEVIEDKTKKSQNKDSQNNIKENEINKNNKTELPQENKNKAISSKNSKIIKKIKQICSQDFILIEELRNICWNGIPTDESLIRAECWKILLGLYPLKKELKLSTIQRKKDE